MGSLSTTSCLSTLLLLLLLLMMRSSTLIMALFALFGYVAARPEMNCYMAHQSANIAFSHREQFELTLNANNGLQREYLCYCVDQSTTCERLDCRWVRKEEEGGGGASSSIDDEIKIITISDEEEEEEVEHVRHQQHQQQPQRW